MKHKYFKGFFLLLIMLYGWPHLQGIPVITVDENTQQIGLKSRVFYLEDTSRLIQIEDLSSDDRSYPFCTVGPKGLAPGFTRSAYWIRFSINNRGSNPAEFIFGILYPPINSIQFYELEGKKILSAHAGGELLCFHSRKIKNRNYLFEITIPPQALYSYYIRVYNNGETLRVPMILMNKTRFMANDSMEMAVNFLYYGFLLFALIFNIFLFISIKDKIYVFFSVYIFFLTLFLMNIDGLSYQLLWPSHPWWSNHSNIIFVALANFFLINFSRDFLRIRIYSPQMIPVVNILLVLIAIVFVLAFTDYPYFVYSTIGANYLSLINTLFILWISIRIMLRYQPARLFFISFILLLLGVSLYVSRNTGVLPNNPLTQYGVKLGLAIQVLFLSFAVSDRFRRILEDTSKSLEQLVNERTMEIEMHKQQIVEQHGNLEKQHQQIMIQNREIRDSLRYAQRIQQASLPSEKDIRRILKEYFIFFKPKDIVSGDFYWITKKDNITIIVAADCTGHGVPGAFMSMLGVAFLNDIVNRMSMQYLENRLTPAGILNEMSDYIINTLTHSHDIIKDGIDAGICMIDHNKMQLQYAGANNTLFYFSSGELTELRGNMYYLGSLAGRKQSFKNHTIKISRDDTVYLFTDGYASQFGGRENTTFKMSRLRELIIHIQHLPMKEQQGELEKMLDSWQNDHEQIDDILIIGFRI